MNAVSRVWSAVEVYVRAISFLLALFCVFNVAAPQAQASMQGQTAPGPLMSAAAYLDHFVSDMALGLVVVGEMLTGEAQAAAVGSTSGLTSQQVSAILSLLSSFGADSTTISKVSEVLGGTATTLPPSTALLPTCSLSATTVYGTASNITGNNGTGVGVEEGSSVTIKWTSENATHVRMPYGDKSELKGFVTYTPTVDTTYAFTFFNEVGEVTCAVKASINKVATTEASLRVLSPNVNEQLGLNKSYTIRWASSGVENVAIALHKNDEFQSWITQQASSGKDINVYNWTTPGEASLDRAVYKIHVTGKSVDSSIYVEDKSDSAFSFVNTNAVPSTGNTRTYTVPTYTVPTYTTPTTQYDSSNTYYYSTPSPTCILKASATKVKKGSTVTLSWASKNATSVSSASGDKSSKLSGSIKVVINFDTTFVKRVYGTGGEGKCQVSVDVSEDTNATKATKVVWNPFSPVVGALSNMQLGAVVLAETYQALVQ